MHKGNPSIIDLRRFALQLALAAAVLGSLQLWRQRGSYLLFYALACFFLLGAVFPCLIRPLHRFFLKLAFILEWLMTRLIMAVIFYFALTPLGLIMRCLGKDPLDRKIEREKSSYWKQGIGTGPAASDYQRPF